MGKDEVARAGVEAFRIAQKFADGVIGEMARAAQDALLDDPRIRTRFKHVWIVIRFEDQAVALAKMMLDELGQVAEVGNKPQLRAVATERERDRISGVMRNGKGVNFNVANREALPGVNGFDSIETLRQRVGENPMQRVERLFGDKERRFPRRQSMRQAAAMVRVFVRNQNAVESVDIDTNSGEPRQGFPPAESNVHEESGALGLEQGDVALAARRQNGHAQADRFPPVRLAANF